jgi:type IV pilus assembly protein PilM
MKLTRQQRPGTMVGLEIEAGSIAAVEASGSQPTTLRGAAVEPLSPGVVHEGEVVDGEALVAGLKQLFSRNKLSKRIRLGVGNQNVVVRNVRLPAIEDPKELDAAVRFQAAEQMPMPLDQAVLAHQVVGGVPAEEGGSPQIDVVVVAARRDMVMSHLAPLRRAGLEPVGIDLSAFAMIRDLSGTVRGWELPGETAEGARQPQAAALYCALGDVTHMAVAKGRACLFTRVSHAGLAAIAERLAAGTGLTLEHAGQWLEYVGLEQSLERLEGDRGTADAARSALEAGLVEVANELRLSLDYYRAQEEAVPVEEVLLCGSGSAIPGFADRLGATVGLPVTVVRPSVLQSFEDSMAARLTLAYGLALDN